MMKSLYIILLTIVSFHSAANQFYHCKDSNGEYIFQGSPCENITVK